MIKIKKQNGDTFSVEVDADGLTNHLVKVEENYYQKLTKGEISKEELIKRSFEFLLKRESNKTILKEFNLEIISKYFPEYESEI